MTTSPETDRPQPYGAPSRGWLLVGALAFAHCLAFADRVLIALLAPVMASTFHLSDFQIGLLQGAAFVGAYALGSLFTGVLADNHRRVRLIVASLVLSAVATASTGLAMSFAGLIAARVVLGFGQSILSPAALSLLTQRLPRRQIGRGISVYTAGSTLGRSLALIGGGALLVTLPTTFGHGSLDAWRIVFLAASLPNLILAALMIWVPDQPRARRARPKTGSAQSAWLGRHWRFYLTHTLIAAATILVIQTVTAWTTTILSRRHGLSVAAAGGIFGTVVLVAAPLGHFVGGLMLDRLTRSLRWRAPGLVMATGLVAAVPLTALFGLAPTIPVSVAALVALTFVMGVTSPAGLVGIQMKTPRHLRGRVTATFLICVTTFGFGLGPAVLGLLTDRMFGSNGIGAALLLVVTLGAILGLSSAIVQGGVNRFVRSPPSSILLGTTEVSP